MSLWRMADANGNRAAEGLRVLEDMARFVWDRSDLQSGLRTLRHRLGGVLSPFAADRIRFRDAAGDAGFETSGGSETDRRTGIPSLAAANARRVGEALRALEEALKTLGHYPEGKTIETLRREFYDWETQITAVASRFERPTLPDGLYGITAEELSCGRKNPEVVRRLIEGGVRIIQYREKEKPVREKLVECHEIRRITQDAGILFIVNDDPLIALETGADGVHLGQDDYPSDTVRTWLGPDRIIGLSTHSAAQAALAVEGDIDYIGVGPIYPTRTKKDVCDAVGLSYLSHVVKTHSIPFVAIGGIKENNLPDVVRAGARTVAMVSALVGAEDIARTVRHLNQIMEKTRDAYR